VQLEAVITRFNPFGTPEDYSMAMEAHIVRVHMDESILDPGKRHHVDADKWKPLIMSFCEFYGLGEMVHPSRLAKVY
jgi:flavin reductase (DIM6/NTAB) family NADH-FMN oxidoreductase RutF